MYACVYCTLQVARQSPECKFGLTNEKRAQLHHQTGDVILLLSHWSIPNLNVHIYELLVLLQSWYDIIC